MATQLLTEAYLRNEVLMARHSDTPVPAPQRVATGGLAPLAQLLAALDYALTETPAAAWAG